MCAHSNNLICRHRFNPHRPSRSVASAENRPTTALQCGRLIACAGPHGPADFDAVRLSTAEQVYFDSMAITSSIHLGPTSSIASAGGGGSVVVGCFVPSPRHFPTDIDSVGPHEDVGGRNSSSRGGRVEVDNGSGRSVATEQIYAAMAADDETTAGFALFLKCVAEVLQKNRVAASSSPPPSTSFVGGPAGHRATWGMAVLLLALGVSEHEIVADYIMHSKTIAQHQRRPTTAGKPKRTPRTTGTAGTAGRAGTTAKVAAQEGQSRSAKHLRAGFAAAKHRYGTLDKYMSEGLKLTEALQVALESELGEQAS